MPRSLAGTCRPAVVLALLGPMSGCSASPGDSSATGGVAGIFPTGGATTGGLDNLGGSNPSGGGPPGGGIAATGGGGTPGGAAATGGSGAATGGQGGGAAFSLSGLAVEDNPNSVLSAYVNWTTDQPANSVVQFGEGAYQWEVSDAELVTVHRV
jgi:hypothetical protein